MKKILTPKLIQTVLNQYDLSIFGIHGISHWARVLEIGRRLAKTTNANTSVVQLFAIFHDSRRTKEKRDNNHGLRGAEYAKTLRGKLFDLSDDEFDLLYRACQFHTDGLTQEEVTIQTCWDSDRLDLFRVGIITEPKFLCTQAAKEKEILAWAKGRAKDLYVPECIEKEWNISEDVTLK